ncbi:MAG TPA: peptidylprolyl isomerase, partial [Urbifossiella sp.]|nr:peptidylprolyl isomerase [Urbifossiella sp.]
MGTRAGGWRWGGVIPVILVTAATAAAQPPAPDVGKRVAAFIHGNTPVTRDELGEYLIARGGMDKIDLVVNRKLVEIEAAKRGISVTALEVAAGVNEDLQAAGLNRDEFGRVVQQRYGKTLYEWENDVVRQRLLMSKMTREQVKVTDDEVRKAFEAKHGERREAFVIQWPKQPTPLTEDVKKLAIEKQEEFEKLALKQPNDLAKNGGRIAPIGRHIDGEDSRVEKALFELKNPGDAVWVETETMSVCLRLIRVVPPDAVTFEQARAAVEKDVFDRKLSRMLPEVFAQLRTAANPLLTQHVPERPAAPGAPPAPRAQHPDPKVLAVLYGNVPVTRTDLGEFLIARGGYERLESLLNVKIVNVEAAKRGVVATPEEIEAALGEDLKGLKIEKVDFVTKVLPRVKKSLPDYLEDEVRPRVLLGKMCPPKAAATDDELKKAFERHYGEKRAASIIIWGKGEFRRAQKEWLEARKGEAQFDRVARAQNDGNLAAGAGKVAPIGRHGDAPNPLIEKVVFQLEVGELSQLFDTPAGILCVKCTGIIPPTPNVDFATVKPALEKEVLARRQTQEVAALFAQLKAA